MLLSFLVFESVYRQMNVINYYAINSREILLMFLMYPHVESTYVFYIFINVWLQKSSASGCDECCNG